MIKIIEKVTVKKSIIATLIFFSCCGLLITVLLALQAY